MVAPAAQPDSNLAVPPDQIDRAIQRGVKFLLSQITKDGPVKGEYDPGNQQGLYGGHTAIVLYALLAAKVAPTTPELQRSIDWLSRADLRGVYAVALRACAMAEWNDPKALPLLRRDVQWLVDAARDGAYSYTSKAESSDGRYDNSNTYIAMLGLRAAAQRGIGAPRKFWEQAEAHWLKEQQPDGGWGYNADRPGIMSYGSMTAAGLASLFGTFDILHRADFARTPAKADFKPIAAGLKWLGENFSATDNPRKAGSYWHYWLFSLEHVGLVSGYKYFGGHNWYAEGSGELLSRQKDDGSWGYGHRPYKTAFAILFLVRGRSPVLINKLKYEGRWNARPRDAANLTSYLSSTFERAVNWQVIDITSPLADLQDAPILYISGAGPCEFTAEQIAKLRAFALRGGLILSEAAGNNADFTIDMQKLYKKLFASFPLRQLAEDHPIYSLHFAPSAPAGLMGVSNGVRLLAIHSPRELSLALQLGPAEAEKSCFELLANIYLFATDKGTLRPRGASSWPEPQEFTPAATIRVARLKYKGNYDPEPLGWGRLAVIMGNRYKIKLEVSRPTNITELDAGAWPVAAMTGTEAFVLSEAEAEALKKYFAAGGTLIIDAAGGAGPFAAAVEKQILTLIPNTRPRPISTAVLYQGPAAIRKVRYRRDYALLLGPGSRDPLLRAIVVQNRLAVIYSRQDLTAALVGYPCHGLRGYSPQSAVALMTNILHHVTATRPAGAPDQAD